MIPAIIYIPLLFTGYFLIDTFNVETSGPGNSKLKTTDYLSSELPEAYTDSVLGDKWTTPKGNTERFDLSGVQNVENDNDSVNKKQDYESSITKRKPRRSSNSKPRRSASSKRCKSE